MVISVIPDSKLRLIRSIIEATPLRGRPPARCIRLRVTGGIESSTCMMREFKYVGGFMFDDTGVDEGLSVQPGRSLKAV